MSALRLDRASLLTLARLAKTPISVFEGRDATLDTLSRHGLVLEFQGYLFVTTQGLLALDRRPVRLWTAVWGVRLRKLHRRLRRRLDRRIAQALKSARHTSPQETPMSPAHLSP